jgi:hypothetical protein
LERLASRDRATAGTRRSEVATGCGKADAASGLVSGNDDAGDGATQHLTSEEKGLQSGIGARWREYDLHTTIVHVEQRLELISRPRDELAEGTFKCCRRRRLAKRAIVGLSR